MDEKKPVFEIRVRLKSFSALELLVLKKKFKMFALNYGLLYSSINPPIVKKKITVLKSPHVNKKARDQFEVTVLNCLIILKGFALDIDYFQKLLEIKSDEVLTKLTVFKCR